MVFEICDKELALVQEFENKHWNCGHPTAGERFTYLFCPTGLGVIIKVRCNCCKTEEDVTDYDSW